MPAHFWGDAFGASSQLKSGYLAIAGWRPDVQGFGGYGSEREARVLGRVLMTLTDANRTWLGQRRGWRQFFDTQVPRTPVILKVGDAVRIIETDRGGYIDTHVTGHNLQPGWRHARIHLINRSDWREHRDSLLEGQDPQNLDLDALTAKAVELGVRLDNGLIVPIRIVGDHETTAIVSDIDDTILVSMVPHKLLALRYILVDKVSSRHAVPGMAFFLNKLQQRLHFLEPGPGKSSELPPPFIFLSNGAWNTMPVMRQFLARCGFPRSTTLLRPWWFSADGLPKPGPVNKLDYLEQLTEMLPQVQWVLVGDNGQRDPEIYAEFGKLHPDNLAAVAIRTLLPLEHLSSHGTLAELSRLDQNQLPEGVPLIYGEDGYKLHQLAGGQPFKRMLTLRLNNRFRRP